MNCKSRNFLWCMVWRAGWLGLISGWNGLGFLVGFGFGSVGSLPFVSFGVGFLAGLLQAGAWGSAMFLDLDGMGLLVTWVHFCRGLCFWRAGGGTLAWCGLCAWLPLWVLITAYCPPLFGMLWCRGGDPLHCGSGLHVLYGRAGVVGLGGCIGPLGLMLRWGLLVFWVVPGG
ncbi:hypothetical protein ILYODFUR_022965 [Ilyodon furcidens]|uniref:NADH dehydrogenase subunit 6 n=1 Tax=Ilyodon furcidens TaxID=33524 RepID=A0ABV0VGA5_9TELE